MLPEVLVKDTAGEEGWEEAAEPGLLNGHVHGAPEGVKTATAHKPLGICFLSRQLAYILCHGQALPAR